MSCKLRSFSILAFIDLPLLKTRFLLGESWGLWILVEELPNYGDPKRLKEPLQEPLK